MTKKDYVLIANCINKVNSKYSDYKVQKTLQELVSELNLALIQDNPRFDIEKFREATGVEAV